MIAAGEVFGPEQRVILQCLDLDLPQARAAASGLLAELQDGAFPLLHRAFFTADENEAFKDADYALLLGAFPRRGKSDRSLMEKNVLIFRTMGEAIERHAKKSCRVIVSGSPANTNAFICAQFAPSLPRDRFTALSRLDQNRAQGLIARGLERAPRDVQNVVVWGRQGGAGLIDEEHCLIAGAPLVREATTALEDLTAAVRRRADEAAAADALGGGLAAARAVADHTRDLHCGVSRPGEVVSAAVFLPEGDGNVYGVAPGLVLSLPVLCTGGGRCSIAPLKFPLRAAVSKALQDVEAELIRERDLALEIIGASASAKLSASAGAGATRGQLHQVAQARAAAATNGTSRVVFPMLPALSECSESQASSASFHKAGLDFEKAI